MATAFSEKERAAIETQLLQAAMRCAATIGMRRTTVDELTRAAGISKGAFYHFYPTKEHLFLYMLETLHSEMYGNAERVLIERRDLPIRRRTALAIRAVCDGLERHDLMQFLRDDVPMMLRKLPQELLDAHYQSDEVRIRKLVRGADVKLAQSIELTCSVIRILLMTTMESSRIGSHYPQALDVLIDGACDRLIAE